MWQTKLEEIQETCNPVTKLLVSNKGHLLPPGAHHLFLLGFCCNKAQPTFHCLSKVHIYSFQGGNSLA